MVRGGANPRLGHDAAAQDALFGPFVEFREGCVVVVVVYYLQFPKKAETRLGFLGKEPDAESPHVVPSDVTEEFRLKNELRRAHHPHSPLNMNGFSVENNHCELS